MHVENMRHPTLASFFSSFSGCFKWPCPLLCLLIFLSSYSTSLHHQGTKTTKWKLCAGSAEVLLWMDSGVPAVQQGGNPDDAHTRTHARPLNEKKQWGLKMLPPCHCPSSFYSVHSSAADSSPLPLPPCTFHQYYSMQSNSSLCLGDQIKPGYLTICWAGVLDCPASFKSCSPSDPSKLLSQTSLTFCAV